MSKSNDDDPAPESDEEDTYVPMPGDDYPWLPPDETLDPLEHADVYPDESQPLVVTPRGGAREIGRSCYQVDSQEATWLVDCGLSPGDGEKFPDFRGLGIGDVTGKQLLDNNILPLVHIMIVHLEIAGLNEV